MSENIVTNVSVLPEFVVETDAEYAIRKFKEEGITVMVTRSGDAPIVPLYEFDALRDIEFNLVTADEEEIEKLKKIPEMRKRFQILESVPYTDIIVAHELPPEPEPEPKKVIVPEPRPRVVTGPTSDTPPMALYIGSIALGLVVAALTAGGLFLLLAVAAGAMGFFANICGKDPIVYARLETGEWLMIGSFYE